MSAISLNFSVAASTAQSLARKVHFTSFLLVAESRATYGISSHSHFILGCWQNLFCILFSCMGSVVHAISSTCCLGVVLAYKRSMAQNDYVQLGFAAGVANVARRGVGSSPHSVSSQDSACLLQHSRCSHHSYQSVEGSLQACQAKSRTDCCWEELGRQCCKRQSSCTTVHSGCFCWWCWAG